jgi:hypothetical protein
MPRDPPRVSYNVQPLGMLVEHGIDDGQTHRCGKTMRPVSDIPSQPITCARKHLHGRPSVNSPPSASSGNISAIQFFLLAS